nr:MFS transporter [Bradyrhizobium brasilense]
MAGASVTELEQQTIRRVYWRLIPILFVMMFFNYLDRINLGYAGLTMNKDLGLSPAIFGFAASIFFLGYMVLEVPSNLMLHWLGARIWLARILITWGLVAALTAFVWNPLSLYVMRFGLGVAEAGFMPGVVLYLTYWFPARYRARAVAGYIIAGSFSAVLGGPISTSIMTSFDGTAGLHGWQWMFLAEGVPTILLGLFTLYYLTDRPAKASWLTKEQAAWLEGELAAERAEIEQQGQHRLIECVLDIRVWLLAALFGCALVGIYGLLLWLPQIIKGMGNLSNIARRHRHHRGQPQLGQDRRSQVSSRGGLSARRRRDARQRLCREPGAGPRVPVHRRLQPQCRQPAVLEHQCLAADRRGRRRLDRAGQHAGAVRRPDRAVVHRPDQGLHRKLLLGIGRHRWLPARRLRHRRHHARQAARDGIDGRDPVIRRTLTPLPRKQP